MADSKITALAALTAADPVNDMFPVVDVSDTSMAASGTTKRISINNILACSPSATLASATITGDLTVDTSTLKVDSTNNFVGIGTASPAVSLDIRGASAAATLEVLRLQNTGGGANTKTRLNFYAASTNYASITGGFGASTPELIFDINTSTGEFIWNNLGSEAMRLNSTANLVLKGGTTGANGVGVTFPAAQVASSNANCLDDYEEGTFTPAVIGTTIAGVGVYLDQYGFYTKVGNLVTIQFFLNWTAHTGTGNMRISGLPFSSAQLSGCALGYVNNVALTAGYILSGFADSSEIIFYQTPTGGGTSIFVPLDTSAGIVITVSYRV